MNARLPTGALPTHSMPALSKDQFEYHWQVLEDEPVICHLEYTPAERGSWRDGMQMEPDYEAVCTLCAAYVCGVDIIDLLSQKQCRDIEEKALIEHLEYIQGEADEAQIAHYISSREYLDE